MSDSYRVGIVGTSKITHRHIRSLARLPDASIVGICGTYEPALREISTKHGIPAMGSIDDLLGQGIDIAVVTTSSERHFDTLQRLLPHVQNVIVEKPITTDVHEALELAEAAQQHGNRLFVVSQFRFDPGFQHIRTLVADSPAPASVRVDVKKHRGQNYYRGDSSISKALFFSQLPHYLDLMIDLFGNELGVDHASAENKQGISAFPDQLQVSLSSQRANIQLSISTCHPKNLPVELDLAIDGREVRTRDFSIYHDSDRSWWKNFIAQRKRPPSIDLDAAFGVMYQQFLARIADDGAPDDLERAIVSMKLIDAIIRASGYRFPDQPSGRPSN